MNIIVRPAELSDIAQVILHDMRHMQEPGFNGTLSHPFPTDHVFDWENRKIEKFNSWNRALNEEHWSRSFVAVSGEKVLGHIHLKNLFSGTLHRAQLGMGLEIPIRGQGIGKKLLTMAIDWARKEESLHWIDLSFFAHNLPARKLYTSCGFKELFTYEDRLRVSGTSIDDVFMMLKLK